MTVSGVQGSGASGYASGPLPSTSGGLEIPAGALSSAEAVALFGSLSIADTQTKSATNKIDEARQDRAKQIEQARRAIEAARKASEKSGFWSEVGDFATKVGTYAAIASAVGGVAASGGSSAIIAAACIGIGTSLAGEGMRKSGVDAELCEIGGLKIRASDLVILGGAVASVCVGMSARPDAGANWGGINAGRAIVTGAAAVQAATSGTQAVAAERTGHYEARVTEFGADQRAHENGAAHQQQQILAAIDLVRSSSEVRERALRAVGSIMETQRSIDVALVGRRA